MNNFIPAYLQSLAKRMSAVANPEVLIKALLSATRQMIENLNPDQTLEEKFDAAAPAGSHGKNPPHLNPLPERERRPWRANFFLPGDSIILIHALEKINSRIAKVQEKPMEIGNQGKKGTAAASERGGSPPLSRGLRTPRAGRAERAYSKLSSGSFSVLGPGFLCRAKATFPVRTISMIPMGERRSMTA